MSAEIQRGSGSMNSCSASLPIPSAQRTGAPIAGRFGWHWGVLAGFVHASVAQTVGQVHGGLVLYNNGFAAGLVAAVLVPVILSLQPAGTKQD